MTSLPKPQGAGDTKKVRKMRKKFQGKAAGGSVTTYALMRQCESVGIRVKPLLTPHLQRHGHQPTLAAKEARQLILHSACGAPSPKVAEIRNLPAVRATLVLALTGAAAVAASPAGGITGDSLGKPVDGAISKATVSPYGFLEGFSEAFRQRFRLRAGLRISSGSFSPMKREASVEETGGWLKSLADAFLYASLGEDSIACPDGPFLSKKRKASGRSNNGRRKKLGKGEKRRRREEKLNRAVPDGNGLHETDDTEDTVGVVEGSDAGGEEGSDDLCTNNGPCKCSEFEDNGGVEGSTAAAYMEMEGKGEGGNSEDEGETGCEHEGVEDSRDGECHTDEDGSSSLPAVETYILTPEQLRENGFPVPDGPEHSDGPAKEQDGSRPSLERLDGEVVLPTAEDAENILRGLPEVAGLPGYVQTQPLSLGEGEYRDTAGSRTFGLDCEMCVTNEGSELTRVTLVNSEHKVLMDQLVKPENRIVDYATRWSGVTPELLGNVDTKLQQVQAAVLRIVRAGDVLVGHSLENDLKALKMIHLRCLDTSLLYPHRKKGRRSSLRYLASMYLRRTIQRSDEGHNSAEDAIAALELAQLKISKGPNFGAERRTDNVFDRLHRNRVPCTMVASSEQCRRHVSGSAAAISSFSDDGVVHAVLKELQGVGNDKRMETKPPMVWAELEGPKCPTIQEVCLAATGGPESSQKLLDNMDAAGRAAGHERRVVRVLDALPPGVFVLVAIQGVNPELPRKLDKQRAVCEDRRCASVWSLEQGRLLEALESRSRDGCLFATIT